MPDIPKTLWFQRRTKVYVVWEFTDTKKDTCKVEFTEGTLSVNFTSKDGKEYELSNLPLANSINEEESKWTRSDKELKVCLAKKDIEFWETLHKSPDKATKASIKAHLKEFADEDDPEYNGEVAMGGEEMGMGGMGGMGGMPGMGGMGGMPGMGGMGGMGGMDMAQMMQGMGGMPGMGGMGDFDDEDEDADLGDLDAPPLEDGPPPLEGGEAVNPEDMEEVD